MLHDNGHSDGHEHIGPAIEAASEQLAGLVQEVQYIISLQVNAATASGSIDAQERITAADPERWLAEATHSLQTGLMFLRRAVAQPTTF
ncbi:TPA: hypothetical protein ACOECQ_000785 [Stenotrophomonas maltophilia]